MNIESINAKCNELQAFIHIVSENNLELSAICIQDRWLSENDDHALVQLDNYTCIVRGKRCSNKGGLIIYLHNKFNHTVLPTSFTSPDFEFQFMKVKGGGLIKPITIGNIYRPPRDLLDNYTTFISELTPILCDFEKQNTEVLISGDFNIDLLKVNKRQIYNEFLDCLMTNSFFPKITLPTGLSSTSATLIDNFFCKLTHSTLQCTSGILMKKLSDHQRYFICLDTINHHNPTPRTIIIKSQPDPSYVINDSVQSDVYGKLNESPFADPNSNYDILESEIVNSINKHTFRESVKFNKYKHSKSKWITKGIIKSIKYKDNL